MDRSSAAFADLCSRFAVDAKVFAAIVTVESQWRPLAFRYEPGFYYTVKVEEHSLANNVNQASERILQKSSFGLAQIMGGTARDLGYRGPLPALFEAEKSVEWGLRWYASVAKRYAMLRTAVTDAIAAYNAGTAKRDIGGTYLNQAYVDKVMEAMK